MLNLTLMPTSLPQRPTGSPPPTRTKGHFWQRWAGRFASPASGADLPGRPCRKARVCRALPRATGGGGRQRVGAAPAQRRARARDAADRAHRSARELRRETPDPPLSRPIAGASAGGRDVQADAGLRRRSHHAAQAHCARRPSRRGKTTLGSALAAELDTPFVELDREIEREAGVSLSEIFLLYGQEGYRRIERRCLDGSSPPRRKW
jgi:hypothetical protein